MVLAVQLLILLLLAVALVLWVMNWPYPSPLVRPLLPARKRWPEAQIREWLAEGHFHKGYLGFFYRDPERLAPPGEDILAPADGPVTSMDVRDGVRYLVIALSFWDMHVQRSPLAGKVRSVESLGDTHTDGEGREFAFLRDKLCPVQKRIVMDTAIGPVAIRLITSVAARRIESWVTQGETVARGQRLGRILLGSTVVLELPKSVAMTIDISDRMRAGQTIVARVQKTTT